MQKHEALVKLGVELNGLQQGIERELKSREQQKVKKARDQILSIAQSVGLPLAQLLGDAGNKSKIGKATVRAQYRNPGNS